jgi:hypothetical protein
MLDEQQDAFNDQRLLRLKSGVDRSSDVICPKFHKTGVRGNVQFGVNGWHL